MTTAAAETTTTRDNRTYYIELLQVLSILAIPLVFTSYWFEFHITASIAFLIVAAGLIAPFLLVRIPAPPAGEYMITDKEMKDFVEIKVPLGCRLNMEKYMLNIKYNATSMEKALYENCGEERVRPYLTDILRLTRVVQTPAPGSDGKTPDADAPPENDIVRPSPADKPLH